MAFSEQELEEFRVEALELLDVSEKSLLTIDQGGEFGPAFDSVFRGFHNLKGSSGMMELHDLQAHTHELENSLMQFKGKTVIPKEFISFFLKGIDKARVLLQQIGSAQAPQEAVPVEVEKPKEEVPSVEVTSTPINQVVDIEEFLSESAEIVEKVEKNLQFLEMNQNGDTQEAIHELYRGVHSLKSSAYLLSYSKLGDIAHAMESSLERIRDGSHVLSAGLLDMLFKSLRLVESLFVQIKQKQSDDQFAAIVPMISASLRVAADKLEPTGVVEASAEVQTPAPAPEVVKDKDGEGVMSIRVPVALLDHLMTLMGEMVLVRNQVLQFSNKTEDLELISMSKRLNVVTTEIQEEMMKTRMQPIGNVLKKFQRVVRDLSQELNKKINLTLSGAETEVDKTLLEAIKDPLTHIVRNSCDHGIETPEARRAAGKTDTGLIEIKSYHEGGQVIVEVRDDGRGLNPELLVRKAIEKGLMTKAQSEKCSEKEIFALIFAPGFSTAEKVTNVSGRGVGMDVVRTNIDRIGGTIDLVSSVGAGTSIKIKIPLTLAIVPALIVNCGTGTFAIPQVKLEELVRVDQSSSENKIKVLHGVPVYLLRGKILPLVDLNDVLKTKKDSQQGSYQNNNAINIAVLNAEYGSFGLIIDEVQDTADIVVKPLNRLLKSLQIYSGATILGNGSVALILDVQGISKLVQLGRERLSTHTGKAGEGVDDFRANSEAQDYLLVQLQSPTKHAIVLGYVHRLEEFHRKNIEYYGDQPVIRYRDVVLPLISANKQFGYSESEEKKDILPVIVIKKADSFYGIVVDAILDILGTTVEMNPSRSKKPCIFGTLNMSDELIVVINPFEMILLHSGETDHAGFDVISQSPGRSILLAEDTVFFRKAIRSILEKAGHKVTVAHDGKEAMDVLTRGDQVFDIVISDIEMPHVNGFQLAQMIRNHPKYAWIPLLAVSSRSDQQIIADCKKSGFNSYREKLKPESLLAVVNELTTRIRRAA